MHKVGVFRSFALLRMTKVCLEHNIFQCLAVLVLTFIKRITDWHEYHRLHVFRELEHLTASFGIEVTYPASGQALFGSGQADVFYGNGHVDIGMVLVVGTAMPGLLVVGTSNDDTRGGREPIALVASLNWAMVSRSVTMRKRQGWRFTAEGAKRTHSMI